MGDVVEARLSLATNDRVPCARFRSRVLDSYCYFEGIVESMRLGKPIDNVTHRGFRKWLVPKDWQEFKLPAALDARLQELLDRQDREGRLSRRERQEARALVELVDMLSLMKLRVRRANRSTGS